MRRLTKVLLGTASLALLAGACDGDLDREDTLLIAKAGGSTGSLGGLVGGRPTDPDTALALKLSPYITCINSGSDRVAQSRTRYLSWVDKTRGPTCRERTKLAPYKLYSTRSCTTDLLRAATKAPRLPTLEQAAKRFATAVGQLKPLLDNAYLYYQTRAYKRDKCAKGKELHPKLMAAWDLALAADATIRARVAFHNEALHARRLEGIEKTYGKNHPRYFHRKVISVGKDVLETLKRQLRTKALNIAELETKVGEYRAIVAKMEAAPGTGGGALYPSYKSSCKTLLEAYDEYLQYRKSGKGYNRAERRLLAVGSGWMVKGSFPRVLKKYNEMVNAFNRVRFH